MNTTKKLANDLRAIAHADERAIAAVKDAAAELDRLADLCASQQKSVDQWCTAWSRCMDDLATTQTERNGLRDEVRRIENEWKAAVAHAADLVDQRGRLRDELAQMAKDRDHWLSEYDRAKNAAREEFNRQAQRARDDLAMCLKRERTLTAELATIREDRDALAEGVRAYRVAFEKYGHALPQGRAECRAWERKHGHRADAGKEPARKADAVTHTVVSVMAGYGVRGTVVKVEEKPLLDLRTLPVGTVCEALGKIISNLGTESCGQFRLIKHGQNPSCPCQLEWMPPDPRAGMRLWCAPMQPARVITQPEPKPQPAPEPFRAGLPALALRRAHREWMTDSGSICHFDADKGTHYYDPLLGESNPDPMTHRTEDSQGSVGGFCPHGATWAEVETKAAQMLGSENRGMCLGCEACGHHSVVAKAWFSDKLGITDPARDMAALLAAFREGQKS